MLAGLKAWIKDVLGLSDALIHVNVGIALFLLIAILLRKRRHAALIAWAVVLILQIGNEVLDGIISIGRHGRIDVHEAIKDTVATIFWPTVLMLVLRLLPANADRDRG